MLTVKLKSSGKVKNLEIKKIKASKHTDSTKIHQTALLGIEYDYNVKFKKKHFIFVVDTSSSMNTVDIESGEGNISRIDAVTRAMVNIANEKHSYTYSIITFDKEAKIVLDGGSELHALRKFSTIKTNVGTSIYHGMLEINKLESLNKTPINDTIIILFSDGYSSVLSEEDQRLFKPESVKKIIKGECRGIKYDEKLFDPQELIKKLAKNGECPRIFPMGMGVDYDHGYIAGLSNATKTPVTHITKQSDFTKALDLGFFDISLTQATLEFKNNNEILHSEEVNMYSGKDKEIILSLDKEILTDLLKNNTVRIKIGNNTSYDIDQYNVDVDITQMNKINKGMALSYYKGKKHDILHSTGKIPLSLIWDIPQTDEFGNDEACREERKKLIQEIEALENKDPAKILQTHSDVGYSRPGGYIIPIARSVESQIEKEKEYICSISFAVPKKPTSVLAFCEQDGYVSVQTYDKDSLFRLVRLDLEESRDELTKKFRSMRIEDPNTRLRVVEPRRNYVKEEEIKKRVEEEEILDNVMKGILNPEQVLQSADDFLEMQREIEAFQPQQAGTSGAATQTRLPSTLIEAPLAQQKNQQFRYSGQ